jgi:N-acetylmuramoyl-L-alanine amidase
MEVGMSKRRPKYYILHCTATPQGREQGRDDILKMHLGPAPLGAGRVRYKGVTYRSRQALPKEVIAGIPIFKLVGRGWRVPGYRQMINLRGDIISVHPDNGDNFLDPWEITNGVAGINEMAIHDVYVGGVDANDVRKAKDTRTDAQKESMKMEVHEMIKRFPDILVGGHYHFAAKACPSFNVEEWLESIGVPEKNILRKEKIG